MIRRKLPIILSLLCLTLCFSMLASCSLNDIDNNSAMAVGKTDDRDAQVETDSKNQLLDIVADLVDANIDDAPVPKINNEYSEALDAYRDFLLGNRDDGARAYLTYKYFYAGADRCMFTIADINFDGIPELHFRAEGRGYAVFSYCDGKVFHVNSFSDNTLLLNNLAVFSDYWAHSRPTSATRTYIEYGEDMLPSFYLFFSYSEAEGDQSEFYRIAYDDLTLSARVSKHEFEEVTSSIVSYATDPRNHDMIQWTNFGEWLANYADEYDFSEYWEYVNRPR